MLLLGPDGQKKSGKKEEGRGGAEKMARRAFPSPSYDERREGERKGEEWEKNQMKVKGGAG